MLLVIVGVQFIGMGLLAELIVRTYYEATDKRIYVVREVLDGETVRCERSRDRGNHKLHIRS